VVAVRARGAKQWISQHSALQMKLCGHIVMGQYLPQRGAPRPGQRLYLAREDNDVVTSAVVAIVRPPKATVVDYPG
jgi:hypothetical protein